VKSRPLVVLSVTADSGSREGRVPVQPYQTLSGRVLLLLELIEDEVLEGF